MSKKFIGRRFLILVAVVVTITMALEMGETAAAATTTTSVGQYPIVDTNQSLCYNSSTGNTTTCSGTGYDADYGGNAPSYAAGTDTVTDNVTGLMWTQSSDIDGSGAVDYDDKRYQSEAISYCDGLTSGGYSDWRLPNIKEAYSLILFTGKDPSSYSGSDTSVLTPFIDSSFDWAFGDTSSGDRIIDGQYASTTSYVYTTMNGDATMFGVNYVDGRIKGYPSDMKEFYVRCVRGNTEYGLNNFTNNNDGTISDLATSLMWQKNDSASTDWDDAVSICEAAMTATHTDWRLPNVKELQSIVDYSRSPDTSNDAAINSVFTSTSFTNEEGIADWGYYWASTTHADGGSSGTENRGRNAAYVSFGRALGYFPSSVKDVHGAGAQRSNGKIDIATGNSSANDGSGTFYYKGPQGDILRLNNYVRCVRQIDSETPVPDIKANSSDGPVTITTSDPLTIAVSLSSGSSAGQNADWWVGVYTPFGWFHYDVPSGSWIPGLIVTFQGSLFNLTPLVTVLSMSGLPQGIYTFYFGVDMIMNGSLDMSDIFYDSIVVNITP